MTGYSRNEFFRALGAGLAGTALRAQDPHFRMEVTNVRLAVSVTDRKGHAVLGLSKDDFRVEVNEQPREIAGFFDSSYPAAFIVATDASRSIRPIRTDLLLALRRFLGRIPDETELAVLAFADSVSRVMPFTALDAMNRERAFSLVAGLPLDGRTCLFDGIVASVRALEAGRSAKQAIVLFGDGGDNASRATEEETIALLKRRAVVVHAVGLLSDSNPDQNPKLLRRLAKQTGGNAGFARSPRALNRLFDAVAEDLRGSYVLSFAPGPADGTEAARVRVRLTAPHAAAELRYRQELALPRPDWATTAPEESHRQ